MGLPPGEFYLDYIHGELMYWDVETQNALRTLLLYFEIEWLHQEEKDGAEEEDTFIV